MVIVVVVVAKGMAVVEPMGMPAVKPFRDLDVWMAICERFGPLLAHPPGCAAGAFVPSLGNPCFGRCAMNLLRHRVFLVSCTSLLVFGMLSACSQQDDGAAQAAAEKAKVAAEAKAKRMAEQLDIYRKQVQAGNDAAADTTGRDIVQLYPGSDAAKEVQQTLPAIEGRVRELAAKARLAAMWSYQVAPMMGGTQSTASILSNQRVGGNQVQLVLRRHTQWGLSVFLYGGRFVCKGTCTLPATFDDKPHPIRGFLPPTGEPSIMIENEKDFIAALSKAKKITIPVVLKDSGKSRDLTYEVGGYDADKWAALPGAKKKG